MTNKKYINEVEPGEKTAVEIADKVKINKDLKSHMPNKETIAKANELKDKMEALEKEIQRLKDEFYAKQDELNNTSREHRNIASMDPQIVKLASMIQKECKVAVANCKKANGFLYRGIKKQYNPNTSDYETNTPDIFVGKPRDDRNAKDSNAKVQEEFDKILVAAGFKALRSNSIFCSGSYSQAEGYGKTYMIFPKDGFSITWSPIYHDLYSDLLSDVNSAGIESLYKPASVKIITQQVKMYLMNFREALDALHTGLGGVPDSGDTEEMELIKISHSPENFEKIMALVPHKEELRQLTEVTQNDINDMISILRGYGSDEAKEQFKKNRVQDLYIIINLLKKLDKLDLFPTLGVSIYSYPHGSSYAGPKFITKGVLKNVQLYIKSVTSPPFDPVTVARKQLQFSDKDLAAAIRSGNETIVTGEYYAISFDAYEMPFRKLFGIKN